MMTPQLARQRICEVLAELEATTDSNVESIGLSRVDVATVGGPGSHYLVSVDIELRRAPGHRWEYGSLA